MSLEIIPSHTVLTNTPSQFHIIWIPIRNSPLCITLSGNGVLFTEYMASLTTTNNDSNIRNETENSNYKFNVFFTSIFCHNWNLDLPGFFVSFPFWYSLLALFPLAVGSLLALLYYRCCGCCCFCMEKHLNFRCTHSYFIYGAR